MRTLAKGSTVLAGTTSSAIKFFVRSSTTGQGLTGLVAADFSGTYAKNDGSQVALSFADGTLGAAYSSGLIIEAGEGWYYYHAPNVMFDTVGGVSVTINSTGLDATWSGQVVAYDPEASSDLGLSNLDAAVSSRSTFNHTSDNVTLADGSLTAAKFAADAITSTVLALSATDAISQSVEAHILDEGDATPLLAAISAKVEEFLINEGDATATIAAIAAATRVEMEQNGSKLSDVLTDTSELQADWVDGGRLDLLLDAILTDTDEVQTDLTDGGRLDLLIDFIKAVTDKVDTGLEADGSGGWQGTALYFDNAPSGGGGGSFTETITSMSLETPSAYYPGIDAGSRTLLDHSGNGRHLRAADGMTQNNGVVFNGTSDASTVEWDNSRTQFNLRHKFSMMMEITVDTANTQILGWGNLGGNRSFRVTHNSSLGALLFLLSSDGTAESFAQAPYPFGQTVQWLVTYDGSELVVYDITFDRSTSLTFAGPLRDLTADGFRVGWVGGASGGFFDGTVKDLAIWEGYVLSDDERDQVIKQGWKPKRIEKKALPVVLMMGQSNLSGEAALASGLNEGDLETIDNPRGLIASIKHTTQASWSSPKKGLRTDTGFGPDVPCAAGLPGMAIYSHGISGTNLHTNWASGGSSRIAFEAGWANAKAELERLGFTPKVTAFVWQQGGGDADAVNAPNYEANLTAWISYLRDTYGDVPFIIGRMNATVATAYAAGTTIQTAQDNVAANVERVGLVQTDDLTLIDTVHYDAPSILKLGRRFAAEVETLVNLNDITTDDVWTAADRQLTSFTHTVDLTDPAALATVIEAAIINEADGQAVMQAIADLIASDMTTTDLTVAAIAAASRDALLNYGLLTGDVEDALNLLASGGGSGTPITLPSADQVVEGVMFGPDANLTGTYHTPDAAEVVDTATYGPSSNITGLVHLPEVSEVVSGVLFGPSSSLTGTAEGTNVSDYFAHLYTMFGRNNVRCWADLDNDEDDAKIDARITSAVSDTRDLVLDELRGHFDLTNIDTVTGIRRVITRLAGVDLYSRRGYEDENDQMAGHRTEANNQLQRIIEDLRRTTATRKGTTVPGVV